MLRFDIVTCLPRLLESPFNDSILKRAQDKELASVNIHDLRSFASGKHRQVDDYAFGGGAGMVLKPEPCAAAINGLSSNRTYDEIIYLSPDGERFDQAMANEFATKSNLLLLCGHYKGLDERIRTKYVTREVSIGDYVLSGGELAAAVVADATIRLVPGVLGNESSALTDSFQDSLLAPPVYTRPEEFEGMKVPEILRSGNEKKIEEWRFQQSIDRTLQRRPDLLNDDLESES